MAWMGDLYDPYRMRQTPSMSDPRVSKSLASYRYPLQPSAWAGTAAMADREPRERDPGRQDPTDPTDPGQDPTRPGPGPIVPPPLPPTLPPPPPPVEPSPPPTVAPPPLTNWKPPPAGPPREQPQPPTAAPPNRRVPISGREDQANLWGTHNPEVWENPDSPDLNRRALRVLMRYPPTTRGIQQAMQDPDWLADVDLAKATYDGTSDRINFHGALSAGDHGVPVNEVDVLAAWVRETGESQGYRWGDVDAMGRGNQPGEVTKAPGPTPTVAPPPTGYPEGTAPWTPPAGTTTQPPFTPPTDWPQIPPGPPQTPEQVPLSAMRDPAMTSGEWSDEPYRRLADPSQPIPLKAFARMGRPRRF